MTLLTNQCPICGEKTSGSAVREVLFCPTHREVAAKLRDELSKDKKYKKHLPKGKVFLEMVQKQV